MATTKKQKLTKEERIALRAQMMAEHKASYPAVASSLSTYDWIVVSSSAGKDSQAAMHLAWELAIQHDVPMHKIVVVHADLGRVEWEGTKELAEKQARDYGFRFEVVANKRDFLERIEARGMWPSPGQRYCTGEFKRNPIKTLYTALAAETRSKLDGGNGNRSTYRVRILSITGIRAQESDARAEKSSFVIDSETTESERNSRRQVDEWMPIFAWKLDDVWSTIKDNKLPYHRAYDLGMPRLSCVFCIMAGPTSLTIAGYHNRALLDTYVETEKRMNHSFKSGFSLITIQSKLDAGYVPQGAAADDEWSCAA